MSASVCTGLHVSESLIPSAYLLPRTRRLALLRFAIRRLGHSPHRIHCGDGTVTMMPASANATLTVALDGSLGQRGSHRAARLRPRH